MTALVACAQLGVHLACMAGAARLITWHVSSPKLRVSVYRAAIVAAFATFLGTQLVDVSQWTVQLPSTTMTVPVEPVVFPEREGRPRVMVTREMLTMSTFPVWGWTLVGIWLTGALWCGGRVIHSGLQHHRRWRGATRLVDRPLQRFIAELSRRDGVTLPVELWSVPGITMPMVDWAGRIGLPPQVMGVLDATGMRAVLAHELAHVARNDSAWRLIAAALTTMGWCVPGLRGLFTRMQTDAEFAADAWASARTHDPLALATALAEAAHWEHGASVAAAAATGDGRAHVLVTRIERLLAEPSLSEPRGAWAWSLIGAAAVVLTLLAPRVVPATTAVMSFQTAEGGHVRVMTPTPW